MCLLFCKYSKWLIATQIVLRNFVQIKSMKTSCYCIILLFFSFTGFCQDLKPAVVKDEGDTLKQIFSKGKVGLVHQNGRQILESKYTGVKVEEFGIRLYDGDLQGYLPNGSSKIIPANYKEITQVEAYFEASTENGTVDLYHGSELIASDLDTGPGESGVLPGGILIIRKEEKAGIIDQKGNVIIPLEYSGIEAVSSFQYSLDNNTVIDYILVLDKSDYFYSPESEGFLLYGEPVLYLAKADGTRITDSIFTEFSYNIELDEFSLRCNNKLAFMKPGFRIDYSPYESITGFMEWKICSTGEKSIVFDRFDHAIDTFQSVIIPTRNVFYQENEESVEMASYSETIFEEFVYVTRNNGDTSQMAIYDLRNRQLVSNWEQGLTFIRKGKSASGTAVWIYMNEWGKVAYRISTAEKSSACEYQDIYPVNNQFYALRKVGEPFHSLCELVGDSVFVERAEIDKAFGSFNYTGINTPSVNETDADLSSGFVDEWGNYYSYSMDTASKTELILLVPFTVFKNAYGKLGFISWDGKVRDLNADTLFQNSMHTTLIEYQSGGLWGAAEVVWGDVSKPDRQAPGYFKLLEDIALIYRLSEDEQRYVDSRGRVFYSTNIERMVSKQGKWKGAKVYSEFEDKMDTAIPFAYREIVPAWNAKDYLVQNKAGKWGVLSAFNDTVFPFAYDLLTFDLGKPDAMHEVFPYTEYDEVCYTTSGNFHGILSLNLRKEIPPVYDWVQFISENAFIVNKGGKYGVYDYNLNQKIKPVFDELMIASSLSGVFMLRVKKNDKWYTAEFFEGKVPDQQTILQALPCDFVVDEFGFIQKENGYEVVNLMDGSQIQKEGEFTDYLVEKPLLVKDGKLYILDSKGKLLYPDALTNVVFQEDGTILSTFKGITYKYSLSKKSRTVFTK